MKLPPRAWKTSGPANNAVEQTRRAVAFALEDLVVPEALDRGAIGVAQARSLLPQAPLVLVACSGGADSLALAAATAHVAPRIGIQAGAIIIDHGLHPESQKVAQQTAQTCERLGLSPCLIHEVTVESKDGPEADARRARYEGFVWAIKHTGAVAVLLAHTLDDQAENVLLGLARGSGTRSLSGMRSRRGPYRRPFLDLTRAQTEEVCKELDLVAWNDPTNTAEAGDRSAPVRSQIRSHVLPVMSDILGTGVKRALSRSADLMRQDADALDDWARKVFVLAKSQSDPSSFDSSTLSQNPPAVRHRVLRMIALSAGVPAGSLSWEHVQAIDALLDMDSGGVDLPGGIRLQAQCGRLSVSRVHNEGA